MKQFECVKKEIQDMNTGIAMTGFIDGIETAAIIWCKENAPNELYVSGGVTKVTVYGIASYLESEIE